MTKFALVGALSALMTLTATATAEDKMSGTYANDPTHTSVTWKIGHLGLSNYTARFTNLSATLNYDNSNPAASSVKATINPASVETDYPFPENTDFDAEIRGSQFFDVAKYAEITFDSTGLDLTDEKNGTLTGNITFHGVTKPVNFNVTLNGAMEEHPYAKKPALGFSAEGTIKRSDFGEGGQIEHRVQCDGPFVGQIGRAKGLVKPDLPC